MSPEDLRYGTDGHAGWALTELALHLISRVTTDVCGSGRRAPFAALVVGGVVAAGCGGRHAPAVAPVQKRARIVQLTVSDLAARLGISRTHVRVIAAKARIWPDGCLGLPSPELCPRERTPGFRISLAADGDLHIYHTDRYKTFRYAGPASGP